MNKKSILRRPNSLKKGTSVRFSNESLQSSPKSPHFYPIPLQKKRVSSVLLTIQSVKNRIIQHLDINSSHSQNALNSPQNPFRFKSPQAKIARTPPFSPEIPIKKPLFFPLQNPNQIHFLIPKTFDSKKKRFLNSPQPEKFSQISRYQNRTTKN